MQAHHRKEETDKIKADQQLWGTEGKWGDIRTCRGILTWRGIAGLNKFAELFGVAVREVIEAASASFKSLEGYLQHHTSRVNAVAFLPNGRSAVSVGDDKSLVMMDLVTKEVICRKENAHETEVKNIAIAPDGSFIVTCERYGKVVKMWDPNDNLKELAELKGHDFNVYSVAVHPNSRLSASGGEGAVKLWEPVGGGGSWKEKKTLKDNSYYVYAVVFSPDGKWLATGGYGQNINVYDVANNFSLNHTMEGHTSWITSLSFAPDSSTLVSGRHDNSIRLWNVTEGTLLKKVANAHTDCEEYRNTIRKEPSLSDYSPNRSVAHSIRSVAHSSNGSRIASCSNDKTIKIWDATTLKLIHTYDDKHSSYVHDLSFSPTDPFLLSGSGDKTVCITKV